MTEKTILRRKPCELKDHWLLREGFIKAHSEKFAAEKLTTLAQLFVNIETLGVKYHRDIMRDIEKLGSKVPYLSEFRTMRKKKEIEKVHLKELVRLFHNNSIQDSDSRGDSRGENRKYDKRNSYKSNYLANYVLNNESDQRFTNVPRHKVSTREKGFNSWCSKRL
uniref:XRN2-binding (XTBD) domain-containing protein n=1 Tax=Tetranychus urticae TaxID=32264 RepID=T1KDK8_TETUR